ncbi:MAG: hypothetical protein HY998_03480 [candidate division NC10 bacterium]|nr:hypothetical protein [candidate division NC10 bacterium]
MSRQLLDQKEPIAVKVVMLGKSAQEFVRDEPFTLSSLLTEMGIDGQMEARVNGQLTEKGRVLKPGDLVLLVPKIRGG